MINPMSGVGHIVAGWARLFSDHKAVSEAVNFVHLAGVLLGGGLAIAADRATLRLARATPAGSAGDSAALTELTSVHRLVLWGLTVIFVSGLLQTLADLDTYLTSVVFWTKMGLVVALLVNGRLRLGAERAVRRGVVAAWPAFRRTSIASLILWFVLVLYGAILTGNG